MKTRDNEAETVLLQPHAGRTSRSVQEHYVAVREIVDDVFCLAPLGGSAETATAHERRSRLRPFREYRAILEVSSVNYALKSEGEQEAITVSYQAFLNALAFPVQVLVRVVRLDLAPYLARLDTLSAQRTTTSVAGQQRHAAPAKTVWQQLAHDHADFVRDLAARRTLLERRFYLIVPADGETARGSRLTRADAGLAGSSVSRLLPGHRRRVRRAVEEQLANARQQLNLRSGELVRQLGRIGLEARRLSGHELACLSYNCLTPARAARHPLPEAVVSGAGRPILAPHAMRPPHELDAVSPPTTSDTGARSEEGAHPQ
jgi:hypothetical protein